LISTGNGLLFSADNGTTGAELWGSDGNEAGTVMVADIRPGADTSAINYPIISDKRLFFNANDGLYGPELWALNLPDISKKVYLPFIRR
jgi:ELWxxDGT repeat protein